MNVKIVSRWDSTKVLFEGDFADLKTAVEEAVRKGTDLNGADLRGADLRGADLRGAHICWNSHTLLGELLFRAAGQDVGKRMVAGLIAISTNWCWEKFLELDHPEKLWALQVLAKLDTDKSPVPEMLLKALEKLAAK